MRRLSARWGRLGRRSRVQKSASPNQERVQLDLVHFGNRGNDGALVVVIECGIVRGIGHLKRRLRSNLRVVPGTL